MGLEKSLADRVAQLLDRIDYRQAETDEQREQIFRLRYHAYLRDGGICPHPSRAFSDRNDQTGNVYLFGLYIDSELASSIRIHVSSKISPDCPALEVFADCLQPQLYAGNVLIDFNPLCHRRKTSSPSSDIALCHTPAERDGRSIFRR